MLLSGSEATSTINVGSKMASGFLASRTGTGSPRGGRTEGTTSAVVCRERVSLSTLPGIRHLQGRVRVTVTNTSPSLGAVVLP